MVKVLTKEKFFNTYWLKYKRNKKRITGYGINPKFSNVQSKNSFYLLNLRINVTEAEKIFGDYLWENKIYFIFQKGFFKPFHRIVDFYIPGKKVIIEIDGSYHQETKLKDENKDFKFLLKRGFKTIRITNEEVYDGSFKEKISSF